MKIFNFIKTLFLFFGDLVIFYFSLFLTILVRYQFHFKNEVFFSAGRYFLPVFFLWIIIFIIGRLYELAYNANRREFFIRVFKIFILNIFIAVLYFYLFTYTTYRPSLVLITTVVFSFFLFILWRTLANQILPLKKIKILITVQNPLAETLKSFLLKNPQLGYQVIGQEELLDQSSLHIDDNSQLLETYEKIMDYLPLDLLSNQWFKSVLAQTHLESYELSKRFFDFLGGILLFLISLPLWPLIALLIKIDSSGEILYRSIRIGRNKKPFYIYKFRTMVKNANQIGPAWTLENDPRITRVGKILRKTHLDELPQVLNIIKGDVSFVGPRPEEEKLTELYEKEIPYYHYRFLMKPGVIGWAQINYPQSSSLKDARHKLEYDFYYFKTRNFFFDFIIALKAWRIPFEIPTH
jgi:lipopolysaccharide/colanic/teichoic acid biosynthesis glycosyltransferase